MSGYSVVGAADVPDHYAGTTVPGEFRRLTPALGTQNTGDAGGDRTAEERRI